jgi:hypothetical protein
MRLLVVGPDGPELRLVRRSLPPALWDVWVAEVEDLARGDRKGVFVLPAAGHVARVTRLAKSFAALRPTVVYTPTLAAGASVPDALRQAGVPTQWLTGVRDDELDLELQTDDSRAEVERVLATADGLLPRSAAARRTLESGSVDGRIFDWVAPAAPIDVASLGPRGPRRPGRVARRVVVDGRHDLRARALVAVAGLRLCAEELDGWRIAVVNPTPDVEVAARLLAGDTSLEVEIVRDASPRQILSDHELACLSIRLSLSADLDWWDSAALAGGAVPIVGRSSTLADRPRSVWLDLVDPDDPRALADAVRPRLRACSLGSRAGLRSRTFARGLYVNGEARLGFAVMSLATGR